MSMLLFSIAYVDAETAGHHGFAVDADGRYLDCLSCHDGAIAGYVRYCTDGCNALSPHPILMRYPPKGKERQFAPRGLLETKGIKLPENLVTCISCHNLLNQEKFHLVVEKRGSKLCFACHLGI